MIKGDDPFVIKLQKSQKKVGEKPLETRQDKRKKLLFFASATLMFLSLAAVYFEVLDPYSVPFVLRVLLIAYWCYSLAGIIVALKGSDELVSKMYFNISRHDIIREV